MFTSSELVALAPAELADLIEMADGATPEECARTLGLDLTDPRQREAVSAAVRSRGWVPEPEGPVIGAGQDHIRENLMPDETPGHGPTGDGESDLRELTDTLSADLSGDDPALGSVEDLTAALAESAASGRPFLAGTFAAYATPDGGVVLVTTDPQDNVRRDLFAPKIVRLVLGLMGGKSPKGMGFLARMVRRGE